VLAPKLTGALSTTVPEVARARAAKFPTDATQQAEYAVHILAGADPMFSRSHHDIRLPLRRLASCSREFLYARFALNIFMAVKAFVTAGQRRRIARFMVVDEDRGPELLEEDLDGAALLALYGAGRRGEAEQEGDGSSEEGENDSIWERYVRDIEEGQRGRPRKRARRGSSSFSS
jgi:hypothetical protein